jgi:two-component system sensor histidine kinase ArlS
MAMQNKKIKSTSLVSRISSFYTGLFAKSFSIALAVILLLIFVFNAYFVYSNLLPYIEKIDESIHADDLIRNVNEINGMDYALFSPDNKTISATVIPEEFENVFKINSWGVETKARHVFLSYSKKYYFNQTGYNLLLYYDITLFLIEIAVAACVCVLLFIISAIIIHLRGNYLTRKEFGVLDELIVKADNISSQNLNLRLNVKDSADELVDFALTFNRMMDRIEKAYEKQKQFVSDASHELRTPISVIQGYARMLDRWGKDDKAILEESIAAINKEAKAMQDLVEKLLFIARNDKDTLILVKSRFNMSDLMFELERDTRMLDTNNRIECSIEHDVMVYGDRDRIKQALRIFVDNAIKYNKPGGTISLRLYKEEKYAVAEIEDTGFGIPEKELPNIFDRFYQIDTSRERNKGGHGLGLAIARIIILRHGGRIKVASKVGEGTVFYIYLPFEHE